MCVPTRIYLLSQRTLVAQAPTGSQACAALPAPHVATLPTRSSCLGWGALEPGGGARRWSQAVLSGIAGMKMNPEGGERVPENCTNTSVACGWVPGNLEVLGAPPMLGHDC